MTKINLDFGTLAEFAQQMHEQPDEKATVSTVLEFALSAVGADYAGVLFASRKEGIETVAVTDPLVEKVDALQMESGEGPDLDLLEDRISVIVPDTGAEQRWPQWAGAVADLGVRSMLGVRISTAQETFGTLNVFSRAVDAFSVEDQAVLHAIARLAAVALSATRKEQNLWRAIDSRKLVGQAQGILMERFSLDADQAFAVLVRYSQTRNVKVATIAEELIESRTLPGDA